MRTFVVTWNNFSEATHGWDLVKAPDIRSLLEQIGVLEHVSSYDKHKETALELKELFDEANGHDYAPYYLIKELVTERGKPTLIGVKELEEDE